MRNCLFCKVLILKTNWESVFGFDANEGLCSTCKASLEKITGEICYKCGRPFSKLNKQYIHEGICDDCHQWEESDEWKGVLNFNRSVYIYNDFLKELLSLYKFRGDFEIVKIFKRSFTDLYKGSFKKKNLMIVPIPLSEERLYERGFNQSKALAELLGVQICNVLTRTHTEKQSKKTKKQRIITTSPFIITNEDKIKNKSVLLVDDIYTTGTTLRQAAKVLKHGKCKEVYSLCLARA